MLTVKIDHPVTVVVFACVCVHVPVRVRVRKASCVRKAHCLCVRVRKAYFTRVPVRILVEAYCECVRACGGEFKGECGV